MSAKSIKSTKEIESMQKKENVLHHEEELINDYYGTNPNLDENEVSQNLDNEGEEAEEQASNNSYQEEYQTNEYNTNVENNKNEISELKMLIENYKKHIEDLQTSSENYMTYNNMLKKQIDDRDTKIFYNETELKIMKEKSKKAEDNLSKIKSENEIKEKIISELRNENERERLKFLEDKNKFNSQLEEISQKLKTSEEREAELKSDNTKLRKDLKEKNTSEQNEIIKNYKNLIENQKETIKNYEKANTTMMKEKSQMARDNENFIEQIIDLEKKIKDKEKDSEKLKILNKDYESLKHDKNNLESVLDEKIKILKEKEIEIIKLNENFGIEREMLKEASNKKIFEYEVELEHLREIKILLEKKNSDLTQFIRSQKGHGNEEFKKNFKDFIKKIKIYFVDYEYLIDKRIIANILVKYFEKSTTEKLKKPLLETLANIMEFDGKTRKILGISQGDVNNKTHEKQDSYRDPYDEIDELMGKIGELNNMLETI